jgi:CDP-diacylglycerol--glycerol-3-phosphate 3-phosphatidyltransferase
LIEPRDERYKDSILTVPNVICIVRMIGSLALFALAVAGFRYWFVGLFLALSFSDWIDGRLARWLQQRSDFGARLDSAADAILYAALIGGLVWLCWETIEHELIWLTVGLGSYALTSGAGLWKFGRVPSYHTYAAKGTQWLALVAGVSLVLDWAVWPLRLATVAVTLTNLEATAITCVLNKWRADVLTLFHVWPRDRHSE